MKENKRTLVLTTLVLLLPVAVGLLLWNQLPAQMPIHWNFAGEVDGWSSRLFAVVGLPALLLVFHWICAVAVCIDPKHQNIPGKVLQLVLWLVPVIGVCTCFVVYAIALGLVMDMNRIVGLLIGQLFVILGNYLPKIQRNYTVGYKLPWTLDDDENWNKTHRLAGKLFVVGGVLMLTSVLTGGFWWMFAVAMVLTFVPGVYSYCLYRKKNV